MEARPGSAGRMVAAAVVAFLVAIVMARLLWDRAGLWPLFLLALPVVVVVLSLAFGFLRALALVALFVATVLAMRWLVLLQGAGWAVLLLAPALLLALVIVVRVARVLWLDRKGARERNKRENGEGKEEGKQAAGP